MTLGGSNHNGTVYITNQLYILSLYPLTARNHPPRASLTRPRVWRARLWGRLGTRLGTPTLRRALQTQSIIRHSNTGNQNLSGHHDDECSRWRMLRSYFSRSQNLATAACRSGLFALIDRSALNPASLPADTLRPRLEGRATRHTLRNISSVCVEPLTFLSCLRQHGHFQNSLLKVVT